jgi:para-aminobenzoate synthetase component I
VIEFHFCRLNKSMTRQALFQKLETMPMPCSLDTAKEANRCAKWNLLTANPLFTLTTRTEKNDAAPTSSVRFWHLLKNRLEAIQAEIQAACLFQSEAYQEYEAFWQTHYPTIDPTYVDNKPPLPGFLGFISYDLTASPSKTAAAAQKEPQVPAALIGYYPWIIVFDCHDAPYLVSLLHKSDTQRLKQSLETPSVTTSHLENTRAADTAHFRLVTPLTQDTPTPTYRKAVDAILNHIHRGDCYQVNLAQRFSGTFEGNTAQAYQTLITQSQAPFSVFFSWQYQNRSQCLLSMSPERFLATDAHRIATFPIKGTAKRHLENAVKDKNQAAMLIDSEKNRAENLMIVDLMRNDLSQIADHIEVPVLFGLKTFQSVFHLESIITGTIRASFNAIDALCVCFPAGSITGAPKKMAMTLIEEYEWHPRTLYCGTFIHLDVQGHLNSNILIRSLLADDHQLYLWSGGGIVADSNIEQEYQETLDKIQMITRILTEPCEL